jgi:TPP-dependent pyruvate/acetoin dehydrogenase alpha subunit
MPELVETYKKAEKVCREEHVPVLVHVREMTQPQGHSTSGSHERYKSKERLAWEDEFDCVAKFREYILANKLAKAEELDEIEKEATEAAKVAKTNAWNAFNDSMKADYKDALALLKEFTTA